MKKFILQFCLVISLFSCVTHSDVPKKRKDNLLLAVSIAEGGLSTLASGIFLKFFIDDKFKTENIEYCYGLSKEDAYFFGGSACVGLGIVVSAIVYNSLFKYTPQGVLSTAENMKIEKAILQSGNIGIDEINKIAHNQFFDKEYPLLALDCELSRQIKECNKIIPMLERSIKVSDQGDICSFRDPVFVEEAQLILQDIKQYTENAKNVLGTLKDSKEYFVQKSRKMYVNTTKYTVDSINDDTNINLNLSLT